jgi:hypothetical protein
MYNYGWQCKCGAEISMVVSKLMAIPDCRFCGESMYMMYSMNPAGEIWMNKALLLEDAVD